MRLRAHVRRGGAIAVVAALALAGCGGSNNSKSAKGGALKLVETTPAAKGQLDSVTWDLPYGEPVSLDYLKTYNYSENTVLSNMCEALLKITPDFRTVPALAEKVEHPSPTTWVYTIRSGVHFWDGKPLTADDVVFSIRRHLDPKLGSYYTASFGNVIKSVDKTGSNQVTITTNGPNPVLNEMMATGWGTVAEQSYVESKGDRYGTPQGGVMCTGPFKFVRWEPGDSITMVRNDNYWNSDLDPKVGRLTFKMITDATTLTNALLSGEIDGTFEAPVSGVDQLRGSSAGTLFFGPGTQTYALNRTRPESLADVRLRKALSLAMDRQGIAKTAFSDAALPGFSLWPRLPHYTYGTDVFHAYYEKTQKNQSTTVDLNAAKKLVQQAGAPSQPLVVALQANDPSALALVNSVISQAQKIGLTIKAQQLPANQFANIFFDPKLQKKFDLAATTNYFDVPDPLEGLLIGYMPNSVQNQTHFSDPVVTRSVQQALATDDPEARARLVVKAMAAVGDNVVDIRALTIPERLFMNKRLTGAPVSFPYQYQPWAAYLGAAG